MPVAGFVRNRRHQFGRQSALGTPVAAVKAYPFKGVPSVNPNWVDPDVDAGSIDVTVAPHREAPDITAALTDPALRYNSLPIILSGFFGGDVDSTGAGDSKTWAYTPSSTSPDDTDVFTYEFGDDVTDDWYQLYDGLLESVEISGPEGLGPLSTSMTWRFGGGNGSGFTDFPDSPTVPTALAVVTNEAVVYLKDIAIAIASDPADFSTSQVTDALHSFTLRLSREIDQKRWANGTQTFDVNEYGTASRSIELECVWSKTSDIVGTGSESDAWYSDTAVDRFVQITATSTVNASTGPDVPFSWVFAMPMRYYTREETESGGNTTVTLTGHAFYDPDSSDTSFGGAFTSTVVNTLAAAGL